MQVKGQATLDAPRERVFDAICDPASLLAVIPGCREVQRVSPDEYRGRIALRLPGIVGVYDTWVRLVHTDPPAYGELEGRVEGRPGRIQGRATFALSADGDRTVVTWDGSAIVSGLLGHLDSRFLEGVAGSLVADGLARLGSRLQENSMVGAR